VHSLSLSASQPNESWTIRRLLWVWASASRQGHASHRAVTLMQSSGRFPGTIHPDADSEVSMTLV
jgi:hypothetical protein